MIAQAPLLKESKEYTPLELAEMKTGRRMGQIHRAKGMACRRRIRVKDGVACYHVMSRTTGGEFLFGALEKEAFRRMMWRMATFSGVEVLTYALMDNHFHILLKVPDRRKWLRKFEGEGGEKRLLAHLSVVYSKAFIAQLRGEVALLREQGREADLKALLERFTRRFCDVSLFVKELKERFTRWYNKKNGRRGTLWMDRFKSVLVQSGEALQTMAAYIDLNPVRAGIVSDPALYEWSGYGEAVGGSKRARRGLCKVLGAPQDAWEGKGAGAYRCWLYGDGLSVPAPIQAGLEKPDALKRRERRRKGFTIKKMAKVKASEGALPIAIRLRKRISVFTTGVAVGSADYVQAVASRQRDEEGRQRVKKEKPLSEGGGDRLFTLRNMPE